MDTFGAADKAHPVPLDVEISGKTYQLSRVRVADFAAATAHLRSTHIRAIMDEAGRLPCPVYAKALAEAASIDPSQSDVMKFLFESDEGAVFMLKRCLKRGQQVLQQGEIEELIETDPTLPTLLFASSGLTAPVNAEGAGPDPTPKTFQGAAPSTG